MTALCWPVSWTTQHCQLSRGNKVSAWTTFIISLSDWDWDLRQTWWRSRQTSASPPPVWTACWGQWPRGIPVFLYLHTGSEWILYLSDPTDQLSIFYRRETYVLSATLKYLERLILAMNGAIRNQREVGRSFCMRMWGWWAGDGQVKWVAGWKIWASNMRAKPSCE